MLGDGGGGGVVGTCMPVPTHITAAVAPIGLNRVHVVIVCLVLECPCVDWCGPLGQELANGNRIGLVSQGLATRDSKQTLRHGGQGFSSVGSHVC